MLSSGVKIDSRVEAIEKYQAEHQKHKVSAWVKIEINIIEGGNYIMGHNIMNLSQNPKITYKDHVRFEQLMSFTYLDFAKENEYVQFTIDGKDYLFKIFSVSYPDTFDVVSYNDPNLTEKDVKKFVNNSLKNSIYDYDIDVNENDTIISLITCTRMFYHEKDFVVDARLVREGESTGKYKVEKNKNYDVVEKMMKGGETTNEEM